MIFAAFGSTFFSDARFLYPHFGQVITKAASFPVFPFLGARRDPHFGQNSMLPGSTVRLSHLSKVSFKPFLASLISGAKWHKR